MATQSLTELHGVSQSLDPQKLNSVKLRVIKLTINSINHLNS